MVEEPGKFIAAAAFDGARPGYVFRCGDDGCIGAGSSERSAAPCGSVPRSARTRSAFSARPRVSMPRAAQRERSSLTGSAESASSLSSDISSACRSASSSAAACQRAQAGRGRAGCKDAAAFWREDARMRMRSAAHLSGLGGGRVLRFGLLHLRLRGEHRSHQIT